MEEENFTPPSDAIVVEKKKSGFTPPSDAIVKKKEESKSTYRKNLLELASKPKKKDISSATDPQKKTSVSGSLGGVTSKFGKVSTSKPAPADMKRFSGKLSNDDLSKMKSSGKQEVNVIKQPSENKRDGFLDYLSDTAEVGMLSVEKFLVDTPEMLYDLGAQANMLPTSQIDRAVTEATGITPFKRMQKQLGFENIPSNVLKEKIDGLNQRIQTKSQDYGVDPLTAIQNGRYSDAAKLIVGSTLQSAPMMAIAIGTGGGSAGLASIGVLTAAGKYKENQDEKSLSQNQRLLNAVGSGVLESTLGHFFSGASGAVAKKILQDKGTEVGSKIISNSFKSFAEKNILKSPVVGLFGEFFEETAVDAGEQLNDIAVGLRDSFDGKRAINAGISSLGMGSTNTVSVYGAKAYMSAKKYNQVKRTNRDITRLQDEINKEGISEESRKIFQIKSDELIANNKRLLGEEVEKLKTLPSEDKALLNKTNAIINDVKSSIDTIKEDKTLSPDAKKIAVAEIYKDYVEAEKTKKQILSKLDGIKVEGDFTDFNGVPLDFDIETSGVSSLPIKDQNRLNKEALASLNAELNPTGMEQVDITGDMVSKRASELYGKEIESTSQQIQTQEMSSPIELQEGEELFSVNEDKGRTFTYTSQTSENNGIKTTKFQFNRSDKDPSQRNATYVPSEEFFNKYNYEIDESYIPEGAKAVGVMEVREGGNSTAATIVFEKNVDGNAQRFDGEVVLKPKNSNESNVKVEELRSQEQTELKEALPNAELNSEGKVDKEKLSQEDTLVFNEIYDKYDKLISPLLEDNTKSDVVEDLPQKLTEEDLPGYDRMMSETDGIVEKSKKRRVNMSKIADNVMSYVTGSKVYEDATDVQREALVRDVRNRFGFKEKSAPSANKILGNIKDVKKVTLSEKTALKKQILDKAKAAKDAVMAQKNIAQQLAQDVKEMAVAGTITAKQAANVVTAFSKTNVFNEGSVDKFTNYTTKVFENAEYQDKIDTANTLASSIKAKLKSKDVDAEVKDLAKKLASLKPSDIEDIDAYIEVANNVNDNIKGSTTRGGELNIASAIDKAKLSEYVDTEINKANEIKSQKTQDSFYELTGLDPDDFTYEEMQAVINDPKVNTKKVDSLSGKIDESVSKMKTLLESYVKSGLDVFTGEKVYISDSVKSNIDKILAVDPSQMTNKDKLSFIDAVNDILVNGDSNKIGSITRKNDVLTSVKKMLSDGIKAKKIRLAFSPAFGRLWFTSFADKKQMVQNMFADDKVRQRFLEEVGVYDIQNGNSSAIKKTNDFFESTNKKYKDVQVNGESIFSPKNSIYANIFGIMNMSNDQKDFSKFKGVIEKSISNLNNGNETNKKLAEEYKKVYDEVLKDSNSIEELVSKTDSNIIDLVNDVASEYEAQFEGKRKVALEVYNTSLDKKKNYIPLVFKKMNGDVDFEDVDAFDIELSSNAEKVYDKKSGTFMERSDYENIKDNTYISLDFMHDNYFKMTESATDSNTAYGIQKLKTFVESKYLKEIIPDANDRDAFVKSMKDFVKNTRNRKIDSSPEYVRSMSKGLDKFSRYGTIQALNKVDQVFRQSIPTMGTTFLNSGGRLGIKEVLDPRWRKLISESGLPVAVRGIDSNVLDFNSLKVELEKPKQNAVGKIAESVSDFQDKQMKWFLGNSDKAANWASWIAYYKKGLADQGINGIDIDSHVLNKKAANYAQDMVDKYQGTSLRALDGNVFTDKSSVSKVLRNTVIPLAKFSINQKTRLYNDIRVLAKSDSWGKFAGNLPTAGVSVASAVAEVYVFNSVKNFFKRQLEDAVDMFMGYEEDEEEKKKRDDKETKLDVLNYGSSISPLPISDTFIQSGISKAYDIYQDYAEVPDGERVDVSPYDSNGNSIGIYEISIKRASEQYDYQKLIYDGKFEEKGRSYQLLPEDLESIRKLSVPYAGNFVNMIPGEMNIIVKRAVYIAKQRAKKKYAKINGIEYKDVDNKYKEGTDGYKGIRSNYK